MATKAYILIETQVGKMKHVADELRKLEAVASLDPVTGPYDIIAVVVANDLNAVGDLVTGEIHIIEGIARTVTCLSVGAT